MSRHSPCLPFIVVSVFVVLLSAQPCVRAEEEAGPKPNGIFSDGVVLQREKPVKVWGSAAPGEEVTVKFRAQTVSAKTDAKGKWLVELRPEAAGGPDVLVITGKAGATEVKNVLVGEVWLGSGQSNMVLRVKDLNPQNMPASIPADAMFRVFTVKQSAPETAQGITRGQWVEASPQTVPDLSALAYFFGEKLRAELNVPVGVIVSAVGGSLAYAWTSPAGLDTVPAARDVFLQKWRELADKYPEAKARYDADLAAYKERKKQAEAGGGKFDEAPPRAPGGGPGSNKQPFAFFNGMIHPLIPFTVRGVIWYQGESDSYGPGPEHYRDLLRALIADWRGRWGDATLPFLIVQLPAFEKTGSGWVPLQAMQADVAKDAGNALVTTVDLGEKTNIHPPHKKPVGLRTAHLALADVYGKKIPAHAPAPASAVKAGREARVTFAVDTGTTLVTKPEGAPQGFEIAGADGKFVPAVARMEGAEVIVSSEMVSEPVKVRYAWSTWPALGIFDSTGLPAGPFVVDLK